MLVSDFDYDLPPDRIAQEPLPERDASRLLLLNRQTGAIAHHRFRELPDLLQPDDVLVVNDSKVIPARLHGRKATGGRAEVLLVRPLGGDDWLAMTRPGLPPGGRVVVGQDRRQLTVEVLAVRDDGLRQVRLQTPSGEVAAALAQLGELPTPPYIHTHLADPARYQTIYAAPEGSIAAPTAGLHFTLRGAGGAGRARDRRRAPHPARRSRHPSSLRLPPAASPGRGRVGTDLEQTAALRAPEATRRPVTRRPVSRRLLAVR